MFLMDSVAATAAMVGQMPIVERTAILRGFPDIAKRLHGCPRFLFDNNSIATAVELTLGRPKVLRETMAHLIVPYQRMWIEWEETGRERLRQRFDSQNNLPLPLRVGFLLEADQSGRRGEITWLWTSSARDKLAMGKLDVPCLAPIGAFFDLDADITQPKWLTQGLVRANIGRFWKDNPIQLDAMESIWRTAEHKPSSWGMDYLDEVYRMSKAGVDINRAFGANGDQRIGRLGDTDEEFHEFIAIQMQDVYGEFIMIWACLLLLTASRPIVERTHISLDKLNKHRRKKGEAPLFDHTKVTMHLKRDMGPVIERGPLGYARKSPRIHMVSSYLARRGNRHWVVMPYMRGRGETLSGRRVHVRG